MAEIGDVMAGYVMTVDTECEPCFLDVEDDRFHIDMDSVSEKTIIIRVYESDDEEFCGEMIAFLKMKVFRARDKYVLIETSDLDDDNARVVHAIVNNDDFPISSFEYYDEVVGHIETLYVNPKYRKKGLSTLLLSKLDVVTEQYCDLILTFVGISPSIINLDVKRNYVDCKGSKKRPWSKEDKELFAVMVKNLENNGFKIVEDDEVNPIYMKDYRY